MTTDADGRAGSAWRRAREVLDAYDADRVCSETLADELVNELAGRGPGGRPRRGSGRQGSGRQGSGRQGSVRRGRAPVTPAAAAAPVARHLVLVTP